jgi:ligand-binding sensor domain-containing protein
MKKLITLFLFNCLFLSLHLSAQNDLKIGQWRTHFPYRTGLSVTTSADAVYWATGLSVLKMSKADLSIERLDKLNSLNDIGARLVRYNAASKTLFVAYNNNNIDLVRTDGGATINISDIKNNINISGDKTIYNVSFNGDTAFLACGFGISRLNLRRGEFLSTTFTKLKTFGVALFDGKIWAATEGGIFTVANDPKLNFLDFKIWKKMAAADGFPDDYASKAITVFEGKLYFDINDTLKVLSQNRPLSMASQDGFSIKYLAANGRNLLVGWACKNDCNGKAFLIDKNGVSKPLVGGCISRPTDGTEDAEGRVWLGDQFNGYRYLPRTTDGQCTVVEFDAPYSDKASGIAANDTSVWVAFDRLGKEIDPLDLGEGCASFIKRKWLNFNGFNPAFQAARDANCVAIHPKDGRVFVGTYQKGLFEIKNGQIQKLYNASNTDNVIQVGQGDPGRQRIAGMAFDTKGNLWLANNNAANPLIVLKADGKWAKMRPMPSTSIHDIVVDAAGYKWILVKGSQTGIIVFDEGKKMDDPTDDRVRLIDNSNFPKELQNAAIKSIVCDLNGAIWVGTSNGVAVFECGSDPFRTACAGRLVVASLSNISEYLLREKAVNAITIDGANRKWFGTNSGLFVTSADGREEIAKFNVENSPLPSNNITVLAARPSGEVFIGTDKGLMSYQSEATEGGTFNKPEDQILAFPNPVRPDYQGPIAIKGFARDANIKIADANGSIVFETKALGGQAIWDGKNFDGRRVQTGVYFILATNTRNLDAPEAVVAKILVVGQ